MQKHQIAIEDELRKEQKAWRDKMMQHEVRFYNEILSKDCEVTVIHFRISVILKVNTPYLFINDKYVSTPVVF